MVIIMTKIIKKAPAKINLFLEVSARRPDGYHDIESVMQTVSLFDQLTFVIKESAGQNISVECSVPDVPCDERNLCYRAAKLFFEAADVKEYDLSISIDKHIPMAAGLGGGSSDAAATLAALNELYDGVFSKSELCALGRKIGADVPFCIMQGISITKGIGDVFLPCAPLPDCYIVIACRGEGVSTPAAYKKLDEMYDFSARSVDAGEFAVLIGSGELPAIANGMTNIFESAVLPHHAEAREIKDILSSAGALRAMMSGSGPSVFGIFETESLAQSAQRALLEKGIASHLCKPYYPES